MKYSLRSLMQFSLRDLFWITVVVAMGVAWWMDRLNSHKELQGVQLRLALEEDNNKFLKIRAKDLADHNARIDAALKEHVKMDAIFMAAAEEKLKKAREAYNKLAQPPLPDSSAPAPNPPKK
jgi:hypothetical protein